MLLLINSILLLCISYFWSRFDVYLKINIRFIIFLWMVFLFSSFYVNGMDWAIYFSKFKTNEEAFLSFEFGFVVLFKLLLLFSFDNFGLAIVYFYLITFGMLLYYLSKYKVNEPFFIAILILVCGYTLILEQLRQFLACLIIFSSIVEYQKNDSLKKLSLRVCFAALFHVSALVMLPVIFLCRIKKQHVFVLSTIISIVVIVIVLMHGHYLFLYLGRFNFIFMKLSYYLEKEPVTIQLGLRNLFILVFWLLYILGDKKTDAHDDNKLYLRIVFVGATIFIFSGMVLFFERLSFYFVFIVIYIMSNYNCMGEIKLLQKIKKNMINGYFIVFVLLSFFSYFRNEISPVEFYNFKLELFNFFDDSYLQVNSEIILSKQLNGDK